MSIWISRLKKTKIYCYYLGLFSVFLFLIFLFFYYNPSFLTLFQDSLVFVEMEEEINTPFSNSSNTEVVMASPMAATTPSYVFPTVSGYYISQQYHYGHEAIDIAGCPYNSNIFAANGGTVVTVSRKWDNGLYIVIAHNDGKYTMYAHLATTYVTTNQTVERGQIIGGMGRSGFATGTHLHFSLWNAYPYQGSPINPMTLWQ